MLNLIIFLVIGSALAYISSFNLEPTTVNLGFYIIENIPLFYVIAASLLTGLVLSYIFQLVSDIINALTLRGKHKEIKSGQEENVLLAKRIHQLEIENERLRHAEPVVGDSRAL